jgi:hypothetical protein
VLRRRHALGAALLVLVLVVGLALVTRAGALAERSALGPGAGSSGSTPVPPGAVVPTSATSSLSQSSSSSPTSARPTAMRVPQRGDGRLVAVKASAPAAGRGRVLRVRVEVEGGVDVRPTEFATQVMRTLNDDRSWGHGGTRSFARTSGAADVVVILASPSTSARLCRPLITRGRLSCSIGQRAILTAYRWARGTPEFDSLEQYRRYVVNHEVGHVLGHGHEYCGGRGRRAPVMQQQTKQVAPCRPNPWPFP